MGRYRITGKTKIHGICPKASRVPAFGIKIIKDTDGKIVSAQNLRAVIDKVNKALSMFKSVLPALVNG